MDASRLTFLGYGVDAFASRRVSGFDDLGDVEHQIEDAESEFDDLDSAEHHIEDDEIGFDDLDYVEHHIEDPRILPFRTAECLDKLICYGKPLPFYFTALSPNVRELDLDVALESPCIGGLRRLTSLSRLTLGSHEVFEEAILAPFTSFTRWAPTLPKVA